MKKAVVTTIVEKCVECPYFRMRNQGTIRYAYAWCARLDRQVDDPAIIDHDCPLDEEEKEG